MNMPEELDTSDGKFRKRVDEIIKSQVQFYCPDGVPTDSEAISKECLPNFAYRNFLGTFDEILDTMEKDLLKRYFKIKAACEIGRRSYNVCYKLVRFDEGLRDLEAELDAAAVSKFSTLGERLDQLHKMYHGVSTESFQFVINCWNGIMEKKLFVSRRKVMIVASWMTL